MNKIISTAALLSCLVMSNVASARGLDISLSQKTAQINYIFDVNPLKTSGADVAVGLFYNKVKHHGVDTDAIIAHGKVLVAGNFKNMNQYFKLGIGAKAAAGRVNFDVPQSDDAGIGYVALGARLTYLIPSAAIPMGIYGEVFYAPQITSFSDTDVAREFTVGFEAEITPAAKAYIGYRGYDVKFENSTQYFDLDERIHVGVLISF